MAKEEFLEGQFETIPDRREDLIESCRIGGRCCIFRFARRKVKSLIDKSGRLTGLTSFLRRYNTGAHEDGQSGFR